ncbi:CHRD domain-containing protein [Zhouia sp. PK063]|uniref:CHRD domain-containing protein n=1 Tax=Zhouia sp. PK063 TaxID=3373602 RepID=UPI00378DE01D
MKKLFLLFTLATLGISCGNDDNNSGMVDPNPTGDKMTYALNEVAGSSASGTATFAKNTDGSVTITLSLSGAMSGTHPAHIHFNTAAEGGDIAISLTPVDDNGMSTTTVTKLDSGEMISYEQLIDFDGYINVHKSASDLGTLIAQGDIGQNALTGESKAYALGSVSDASISGTATLYKRTNGYSLLKLSLNGTMSGMSSPAHIHFNTAAEGGDIAISLTAVDGATGMSATNIEALDDGTSIMYDALLDFDGYINVHKSASDLATLIAQGDIGQNELTGDSKEYALGSVSDASISGTATLYKRASGYALLTLKLDGTMSGMSSPAHIHFNTAAEGGGIAISLTAVDGATGMSKTNIEALDDGTDIMYDALLDFDGYINVHKSASDLATLIAQGDIGQNELTGDSKEYALGSVSDASISGTATLYKRASGYALLTLKLDGTMSGMSSPAHIHFNTAAEGGGIAISLTAVDGATGMSKTNIEALDDGTDIMYDALLDFDGYINVHKSASDLATLIAQGDIGQNELTGNKKSYDLNTVAIVGVSGKVTFEERVNHETLAIIDLNGVTSGTHPAHIHKGSVATAPGDILVTFAEVDATGMSKTNITQDNDGNTLTYDDVISLDGYVNVHLSAADLSTLIAQGNIGINGSAY